MFEPLNDTLASPWVCRRSSPVLPVSPTRDFVLLDALTDGFTRRSSLRARPPFTRPCHSFWSAYAELIRDQVIAYRLLQLHFDVRATKPCIDRLLILAGTETLISFLFLSTSRPLPCGIGEVWRAALRPFVPTPVLVRPGYPGLPNRDADSLAPPPSTFAAGA
jgi:hypothetical protein